MSSPTKDALTEEDALRAYAKMLNTLSVEPLVWLLADDFVYESQMVILPLATSRQEFLDYIRKKFRAVVKANATVYAEMGWWGIEPCVLLAQNDKEDLKCLVMAKVKDGKLSRLDLCIAPSPWAAKRSGEYPV